MRGDASVLPLAELRAGTSWPLDRGLSEGFSESENPNPARRAPRPAEKNFAADDRTKNTASIRTRNCAQGRDAPKPESAEICLEKYRPGNEAE